MRSIRSKTILLSVVGITIAIFVSVLISSITIANLGHSSSENTLMLLCETGKNNLNYYFKSVEQSVSTVSSLIEDDLKKISDDDYIYNFENHINYSKEIFAESAINTNGVYTYYYRLDPSESAKNKQLGYWYIKDKNKFVEHEVTDLNDRSKECRWFYITKDKDEPIWLTPYMTDNLNEYVVSYNAPIHRNGKFIGVVGIEISYETIGEKIKDIKINKSGYAFVVDSNSGSIIYHPYIDLSGMDEKDRPLVPDDFYEEMKNGEHHLEYTYEGVKKHAYILELGNGMSVVVAVPISEVNETWYMLVIQVIVIGVVLIEVFVVISIFFSRRITKQLFKLTKAANEINEGNYDIKLDYNGKDEIGVLTSAVNKLVKNLGEYINDLNSLAYADPLTSLRNKGAFDLVVSELQKQIDLSKEKIEFAIAILDCDDLKDINDSYGHDKGDVYLRNSCNLMCRVFKKSVVYRIGGDEFAIILQGEDYQYRKELTKFFVDKSKEICAFAKEPWEQIRVSIGVADFDSEIDKTVEEVIIHADHLMYENKRDRKKNIKRNS